MDKSVALEIVLIALDLFLLAVHQVDVVAQEQMQIFMAIARQLLFDRLELEQQVVAECAGQRQPAVLFVAELFDQRAQDGKAGGLLAALFFGKQLRQRLQAARQRAIHARERFPVRMALEHRQQDLIQDFAADTERAEFHLAVVGHDLERRRAWKQYPSASNVPDIRIRKKDRCRDDNPGRATDALSLCGNRPL